MSIRCPFLLGLVRGAVGVLTIAWCGFFVSGCGPSSTAANRRIQLSYWEKWTGEEAAAMQATVDAFNASQDRIQVNFVSTAQADRKLLTAVAGGDPPDIAGVWIATIAAFADRDALMPLDDLMRAEGQSPEEWLGRYAPVYAHLGQHAGKTYGLPTTGSVIALHWNKALFREAGLDPERPPHTLAELENYSRRLTKRDPATGALTQVGFLRQDPNWYLWSQPLWFGGGYFDAKTGAVSVGQDPASLASFRWLRRCTEEYGLEAMQRFTSGFGPFASSQNSFFSGKVAMTLQGVWLNRFAREFAPALDYGVAPWPIATAGAAESDGPRAPFVLSDGDLMVIPRGVRHPQASWEFLRYVASHNPAAQTRGELQGIEIVCFLQEKTSPLRAWSPFFGEHHPHPRIALFRELEGSAGAVRAPDSGVWEQYARELTTAAEKVCLLAETPDQALAQVQSRMTTAWAQHQASLERQRRLAAPLPPPAAPR